LATRNGYCHEPRSWSRRYLSAYPTDVLTFERGVPARDLEHHHIIEEQEQYVPAEICETIGQEWFWIENYVPRRDEELLGIYLLTRSRGTNLLLDVPPDRHGLIPAETIAALQRLRANIENLGFNLGL
jgi:alpha-L-fucosidase